MTEEIRRIFEVTSCLRSNPVSRMLAFMGFFICVSVHWNARMTEMEQSGIEVILAFADNVPRLLEEFFLYPEFIGRQEMTEEIQRIFEVVSWLRSNPASRMLAKSCERDHNMVYIIHNKWLSDDLSSREMV